MVPRLKDLPGFKPVGKLLEDPDFTYPGLDDPIPTKASYHYVLEVDGVPSDPLGRYASGWTREREDAFQWVQGLMRRFTYKPGWHIDVHRLPEGSDSVRLDVYFMAPDSRDTPGLESMIKVSGTFDVPEAIWHGGDEGEFWDWLRRVIRFVEQHELDEWFCVDGKLVNDPHANPGRVFRG